MKIQQRAFQLPVDGGHCFCVYRRAVDTAPIGTVLHLPAFGDEMNKSRAMTARAARAFASRGFGVLQVDLFGCGDSSGAHAEATFARWSANLQCALAWLREENRGVVCEWLWALRAGALLAPTLLEGDAPEASLLLWQPVLTGDAQLKWLLRQKLASALTDPAGNRGRIALLRERLLCGETLEIGGYAITPAIADDLERAVFTLKAPLGRPIAWFEMSAANEPTLSQVAAQRVAALQSAGAQVTATAICGPSFWQSVEIERSDTLIAASAAALTMRHTDGISRDPVAL